MSVLRGYQIRVVYDDVETIHANHQTYRSVLRWIVFSTLSMLWKRNISRTIDTTTLKSTGVPISEFATKHCSLSNSTLIACSLDSQFHDKYYLKRFVSLRHFFPVHSLYLNRIRKNRTDLRFCCTSYPSSLLETTFRREPF